MKYVTRIQTLDGTLFEDKHMARNHAERRYGDALCKLARGLLELKYTQTTEYLDENLDAFVELHQLKTDIPLESSND